MTHPPNAPYGQPGPYGPHGGPGQWGQPGPEYGQWPGPGHHPLGDGFPRSGPQAGTGDPGDMGQFGRPGPWEWQPDPWGGQPDPWGGQVSGDAKPPKRRTGLITGVVVAVALLAAGGVTAALLLTGKDGKTTAAVPSGGTPYPPSGTGNPPAGGTAPSRSSSGAPGADPASVAQAVVASINTKNVVQYASQLCTKPEQGAMDELKSDWDGDSTLHASLAGSPRITGSKASVTVALTYHGQSLTPDLNLQRRGAGWCADISS